MKTSRFAGRHGTTRTAGRRLHAMQALGMGAVLMTASLAMAQRGNRGGMGGPGDFGMGNRQASVVPAELKTQLDATDEEWKVIGPKLAKLISARQALTAVTSGESTGQTANTGRGMGGGPGGGGGGNDTFGGPGANAGGNGPGGGGPGGGMGGAPGGFGPPPDGFNPDQQPQEANTSSDASTVTASATVANKSTTQPATTQPTTAGSEQKSTLAQAYADLQTAIKDSKTTDEQMKEKLEVFRAACRKTKAEINAVQQDLLVLLTSAQQARLVTLGYMD